VFRVWRYWYQDQVSPLSLVFLSVLSKTDCGADRAFLVKNAPTSVQSMTRRSNRPRRMASSPTHSSTLFNSLETSTSDLPSKPFSSNLLISSRASDLPHLPPLPPPPPLCHRPSAPSSSHCSEITTSLPATSNPLDLSPTPDSKRQTLNSPRQQWTSSGSTLGSLK